jgi:hypothetical protein
MSAIDSAGYARSIGKKYDPTPSPDLTDPFIKDFDSEPPSLCFRNGSTCSQGNVPVFAVLAGSTNDIQVSTGNMLHIPSLRILRF